MHNLLCFLEEMTRIMNASTRNLGGGKKAIGSGCLNLMSQNQILVQIQLNKKLYVKEIIGSKWTKGTYSSR